VCICKLKINLTHTHTHTHTYTHAHVHSLLRRFIASCYVCMFGLLIVLAEVRIVAVLKWFPFLTKPFGECSVYAA
jgi:hypothetical protein